MWRKLNLGFSYLAGSISARSAAGDEFAVDETDPVSGLFAVELPDDFAGRVSLNFQRVLLRASEAVPDEVIGTANACIYCGAREDLRDEHVVPYGLQGHWVLRQASCRDCETITSRFERVVLRNLLLPARTSLEIRTRRPKERSDRLPLLELDEHGKRRASEVDVHEHPTYLALPRFLAPARLRGADEPNLVLIEPWQTLVGQTTLIDASLRRGGANVGVQLPIDVYAFARMIGKIGHCFAAVANRGIIATDLPAYLRANDESIGWLVGGAPNITQPQSGLHAVGVGVVAGVIHVRVRLFAQFGGPEYLVLAGRLSGPGPKDAPSASIKSRTPLMSTG